MIDDLLHNPDFWLGVRIGALVVILAVACRVAHSAHRGDR